jgi:hypothetical protein
LVQTWAVPDTAEKDITVTMTVTNVGNTTVSALELTRMTQTMDEFHHPFFLAGTTTDSAFQWWHEVDPATPTHGVVATAASFGKPHDAGLATDTDLGDACGDYAADTEGMAGGGFARIRYLLGDFSPGDVATVKVTYARL